MQTLLCGGPLTQCSRKVLHSSDPLLAVGQGNGDKGMLQSATKDSAVSCEWNVKQFASSHQAWVCKAEAGAWEGRSECGLGTEAKQGGIGVGHVETSSCWGGRTAVPTMEEGNLSQRIPQRIRSSRHFHSPPRAAQSSRLHTMVASSL